LDKIPLFSFFSIFAKTIRFYIPRSSHFHLLKNLVLSPFSLIIIFT